MVNIEKGKRFKQIPNWYLITLYLKREKGARDSRGM